MNKLSLKVYEIIYLIEFLPKLKLVDYESRMRTRFYKLLFSRYQQFQEEKTELIKECAELDEQGNFITTKMDNGNEGIKLKDFAKFQKQLYELTNEAYTIQIDDNNRKMISSVTKNILNCGLEFDGEEAILYDEICEKFEELEFEGENNEG